MRGLASLRPRRVSGPRRGCALEWLWHADFPREPALRSPSAGEALLDAEIGRAPDACLRRRAARPRLGAARARADARAPREASRARCLRRLRGRALPSRPFARGPAGLGRPSRAGTPRRSAGVVLGVRSRPPPRRRRSGQRDGTPRRCFATAAAGDRRRAAFSTGPPLRLPSVAGAACPWRRPAENRRPPPLRVRVARDVAARRPAR